MGILKGLLAELSNPYASIAENGVVGGDITSYVDTGIYVLNALISGKMITGGFPAGKVTALAGPQGCGKTYLLMGAFKTFLDNNPEGEIILFESEGAVSKELILQRGIDPARISVVPVSTIEEFRHQVIKTVDYIQENTEEGEYPNVIMALDSLGMLSTEWEIKDAKNNDNKADMGKRAKLIKSTFRVLTLKLSVVQIPFILTNHTYASMSMYAGDKMSGGTGLEYAASIVVYLSKSKVKDNKSKIKNLAGNSINCRLEKGRLTVEGSKISLDLDFKTGISPWAGILLPLVESGIFGKKGSWISYNGENVVNGDNKFYEKVDEIMTPEIIEKATDYLESLFSYG